MNIAYINENQDRLYDSYMLCEKFRVSKSKLQKLMEQYTFSHNDYVMHQNRFLFREDSIVRFLEFIVVKKNLNQRKQLSQSTLQLVRERLKNLVRNNELNED